TYYIIESGAAEVWRAPPGERARRVGALGPGQAFGEEALLTDQPRAATVVMTLPGRVWTLDRGDFDQLVRPPLLHEIDPAQALSRVEAGARWLDCRWDIERRDGGMPGAALVPLPDLRARMSELDRDATWICYCSNGRRGSCAAFLLRQSGFDALSLAGGLREWPFAVG
ncbi:MAG: cyclic nucleotide-binding domain-containing protein, partial [Alphaproteobacteria bacterium]|nr:cyclic nucleotide-binding domain-containing protein [Alphaproteobacteria bacterium]